MKKTLLLCAVIGTFLMLEIKPVQAVEMCYEASVRVDDWSDGTGWCSPLRPNAATCNEVTAANGSTGRFVEAIASGCYPTDFDPS